MWALTKTSGVPWQGFRSEAEQLDSDQGCRFRGGTRRRCRVSMVSAALLSTRRRRPQHQQAQCSRLASLSNSFINSVHTRFKPHTSSCLTMASDARGGLPRPVPQATVLYKHATVVATFSDLGDIKDGAILVNGHAIEWVGPTSDLPPAAAAAAAAAQVGVHAACMRSLSSENH